MYNSTDSVLSKCWGVRHNKINDDIVSYRLLWAQANGYAHIMLLLLMMKVTEVRW